jgi:hypothetical protein
VLEMELYLSGRFKVTSKTPSRSLNTTVLARQFLL